MGFEVKRIREVKISIREGSSVCSKVSRLQVWLTQRMVQYSMAGVQNGINTDCTLIQLGPPTSIIIRLLFFTKVTSQKLDEVITCCVRLRLERMSKF